jgi:hypothetical protein
MSVKEIVRGAVAFATLMSEGDQGGIELLDDSIHTLVVGHWPSIALCDLPHLSVDEGDGGCRPSQGESFNHALKLEGETPLLPAVTAPAAGEPGETLTPVMGEPALEGTQRDALVTSEMGQRNPLLQVGLQTPIALHGLGLLAGRQGYQRRSVLRLPVHGALVRDGLGVRNFADKIRFSAK